MERWKQHSHELLGAKQVNPNDSIEVWTHIQEELEVAESITLEQSIKALKKIKNKKAPEMLKYMSDGGVQIFTDVVTLHAKKNTSQMTGK